MSQAYDVIVAGLGAMGSAAARMLALRGRHVLGLDRFEPPHGLGSSHGRSRIIREAYFEHPSYVPLVQRAYQHWAELERELGERLLMPTGGLMVGPPEGELVKGALASAREHGLSHELLSAADIERRVPALRPGPDMVGVWEPRAGVLFPEVGVAAALASARSHQADLRLGEPMTSWRADGDGVEVQTTHGNYRAGRLVITAGAWLQHLLPDLTLPLTVERNVLYWFEPAANPSAFDPGRFPIFILEHAKDRYIYGFPRLEGAVKVARHHEGEPADPDTIRRDVSPGEIETVRAIFRPFLPGLDGPLRETAVCMYTNTPDNHFMIGFHPRHPQVLLVSACSGHGFKFAPAIGEIVSDLVTEGATGWDLRLFALGRPGAPMGEKAPRP